MSDRFGMPGPGGSLGQCALCGKDLPHESPLKQAWLKTISEAEVILS
jgi:hypothetical protein